MKLILAPMEGVMDGMMRDIITSQNHPVHGGYDQAVTEFIRVTDQILPETTFQKYCPELKNNCRTTSGVPVFVQLLGGDAEKLAGNAKKACDLGAIGVDLNFGCPAPTVNRHDGGATLLKYPDRLSHIVSLVRKSVPDNIPVTAKIRLGFEKHDDCLENVKRIQDAGASWITVHCRTKKEMYQPLIHWNYIPKIAELISIPIVVNGEMWSKTDVETCGRQTSQNIFMIGRGAMANPFVAAEIKTPATESMKVSQQEWTTRYIKLLQRFANCSFQERGDRCTVKKLKQWIRMTAMKNPNMQILFNVIKTCEETSNIVHLTDVFLDSYLNEKEISYASKNQSHHESSMSLL